MPFRCKRKLNIDHVLSGENAGLLTHCQINNNRLSDASDRLRRWLLHLASLAQV
jgi:hypothetical protein